MCCAPSESIRLARASRIPKIYAFFPSSSSEFIFSDQQNLRMDRSGDRTGQVPLLRPVLRGVETAELCAARIGRKKTGFRGRQLDELERVPRNHVRDDFHQRCPSATLSQLGRRSSKICPATRCADAVQYLMCCNISFSYVSNRIQHPDVKLGFMHQSSYISGEPKIYLCDDESKARLVIDNASSLPFVKTVVVGKGTPSRDLMNDARSAGIQLMGINAFMQLGKDKRHELIVSI